MCAGCLYFRSPEFRQLQNFVFTKFSSEINTFCVYRYKFRFSQITLVFNTPALVFWFGELRNEKIRRFEKMSKFIIFGYFLCTSYDTHYQILFTEFRKLKPLCSQFTIITNNTKFICVLNLSITICNKLTVTFTYLNKSDYYSLEWIQWIIRIACISSKLQHFVRNHLFCSIIRRIFLIFFLLFTKWFSLNW